MSRTREPLMKKETVEQVGLAVIGSAGVKYSIENVTTTLQFWTLVISFFFILIPTAIWASLRAYSAIKKFRNGGDVQ